MDRRASNREREIITRSVSTIYTGGLVVFNPLPFQSMPLHRRVRAPITKTRPNNIRQRSKSKKSATLTSKGKFYENADSANING